MTHSLDDQAKVENIAVRLKVRTLALMAEHPDWSKEYAYLVATMELGGVGDG